jgi:hypothetical protein
MAGLAPELKAQARGEPGRARYAEGPELLRFSPPNPHAKGCR